MSPIHKKTIVIGSTLPALLYSYINEVPFICCRLRPPFQFDFFSPNIDLSSFQLKNKVSLLETPYDTKVVGTPKLDLWDRIHFTLSVSSKNLMTYLPETIEVDPENNVIKAATLHAKLKLFSYERLIIFDKEHLMGIKMPQPPFLYEVCDFMKVKSGRKHEFNLIETTSKTHASKIYYFHEYQHKNAKLAAQSFLSEEDLKSFEGSDTGIMFAVRNEMKKHKIRGIFNGHDSKNPKKLIYYAIKLEPYRREIRKISLDTSCKITDNIEINCDKEEDLILSYKPSAKKSNLMTHYVEHYKRWIPKTHQ